MYKILWSALVIGVIILTPILGVGETVYDKMTQDEINIIRFDTLFRDDDANSWVEYFSKSVGRNTGNVRSYMIDFALFFMDSGMDYSDIPDYAKVATGVSIDTASYYAENDDTIVSLLRTFLTGNHSAFTPYGIDIEEKDLKDISKLIGFGSRLEKLGSADIVLVRLEAFLSKTMNTAFNHASEHPRDEYGREQQNATTIEYPAGKYKVDADIPAGVYFAKATQNAIRPYIEVTNRLGSDADALSLTYFSTFMIIGVRAGEYIKVSEAELIDYTASKDYVGRIITNGVSDGMYEVGFHIPAGEYLVIKEQGESFPYIGIYADPYQDEILSFKNIQSNRRITLNEGTFVEVSNATMFIQ